VKLWNVLRRAPLAFGERVVRTERFACLAKTAEEAIAIVKAGEARGIPELSEFISGTWSAEVIEDPPYAATQHRTAAPTAEEIEDRQLRALRRQKRFRDRKRPSER